MFTFKKDSYSKNRNSYSRRINLHCYKCNYVFATYQKDGPGNLRRMYFDRILSPKELVGLENKNIDTISNLSCPKCSFEIAVPYMYEKEQRPAFRVYQDAVVKRVRKLN